MEHKKAAILACWFVSGYSEHLLRDSEIGKAIYSFPITPA